VGNAKAGGGRAMKFLKFLAELTGKFEGCFKLD
jgi:hypothetical protein